MPNYIKYNKRHNRRAVFFFTIYLNEAMCVLFALRDPNTVPTKRLYSRSKMGFLFASDCGWPNISKSLSIYIAILYTADSCMTITNTHVLPCEYASLSYMGLNSLQVSFVSHQKRGEKKNGYKKDEKDCASNVLIYMKWNLKEI